MTKKSKLTKVETAIKIPIKQKINIQISTTEEFINYCDYMDELSKSGMIDPDQAGELIKLWRTCAGKYISIDL
ncbi:hypothetical protein [Thiolapillus sp.]|uniref:hypothetical protein n=1 Tax=Thiolapillus sp. TaxID=2017437 RepID=UPI003AF49F1F